MWKISINNLRANKGRLSLTGLAIVLGVSFVTAAFVMSDGLRDSFGTLVDEVYEGTDLVVREDGEFGVDGRVDESTLALVEGVDGVRMVEGTVGNDGVQPVKSDGTVISSVGPPQFGFSWSTDPDLNPQTLTEGTAPGPGQFVMDISSAERHDFEIGETYGVVTETGSYEFELSGYTKFGADNSTNGALLTAYSMDDAQLITGFEDDEFDTLDISVADGYSASDVQASIAALMPAGVEVANNQTLQQEQAAEFNETIGILQNILLGFALISLFVSIFIIYNTFGIVVAQRVREIGLLRAIGAEARQIRASIIVEALIIGAVASAIGIAAGVGLNLGLRAMFDALGIDMPPADTILALRTVLIALGLGIGVTVVSSVAPSLKASRVSPIAALSGATDFDDSNGRFRMFVGAALGIGGLAIGAIGLQGGSVTSVITMLAIGAIAVFISVAMLSPLVARPIINVVAWPISKLGVSGSLARKNAGRNPRRTSTTAAALMIGLSLITTALVVGDSLKAQISSTLETANSSDYLIAEPNFDDFPVAVADEVRATPEIGSMAAVGDITARVSGVEGVVTDEDLYDFNFTDFDAFASMMDLSVATGAMAGAPEGSAVLPEQMATDLNLGIGDPMELEFRDGSMAMVSVVGIYTDQSLVDGPFIDTATVEAAAGVDEVGWIVAKVADDSTAAEAETAMAALGATWPQLDVQSSAEYRESVEGQIDQMLNIISAMLSLAILIALLGIGLTLALAIVERTRELGLLRAVGMTRPQLRRMVRWEAAAVAVFGAVLGVAIGLVFGWATVVAMPDTFIRTVSIPVVRLAVMVLVAGAAGLIAALLPARRGGRLNVLDAIAM